VAKPNFRWFGSGQEAIVFDVDDVSAVRFESEIAFFGSTSFMRIIRIEFYHRDTIKVSWLDSPGFPSPTKMYQQIHDWAEGELTSGAENGVEDNDS